LNQANTQALKVALVTGAARRIGAAIAEQLHQAGYSVIIHCRSSLAEAQSLAQNLNQKRPNSALVLPCDLCTHQAIEELISSATAWVGRLDVLVNNASIFSRTDLADFDDKGWSELFETNVKIPFQLSLAARPYLALQQGAIINITDIHADKPLKGYAVYCQTKAALVMQTKALAREFAPQIRVNAIAPGAIAWPEQGNVLSLEQKNEIINKTPLKRHGSPLFIAQAVLALIENPFITGQILNVDGGRSV